MTNKMYSIYSWNLWHWTNNWKKKQQGLVFFGDKISGVMKEKKKKFLIWNKPSNQVIQDGFGVGRVSDVYPKAKRGYRSGSGWSRRAG